MIKIKKKNFLLGFLAVTFFLALVRLIFPSIAEDRKPSSEPESASKTEGKDAVSVPEEETTQMVWRYDSCTNIPLPKSIAFFKGDGGLVKERIYSVPNFGNTFPDLNDVQLQSAQRWGVKPSDNLSDMDRRKDRLVYVGSNFISTSIVCATASPISFPVLPSCCRTSAATSSTVFSIRESRFIR